MFVKPSMCFHPKPSIKPSMYLESGVSLHLMYLVYLLRLLKMKRKDRTSTVLVF